MLDQLNSEQVRVGGSEDSPAQSRRVRTVLLAVILLLAAGLRLYRLGYESLSLDEIGQIQVAGYGIVGTARQSAWHVASTPLDYLVTHMALEVGNGPSIVRLPAAVWGILTVAAAYLLGKQTVSPLVGLIAALAVSVMPLPVYWSRVVRFYSLPVFLFLLCTLSLWLAVEIEKPIYWISYALILLLALYAHYYALVLVSVQVVWLLGLCIARRRNWRQLLSLAVCIFLALILFAPWAYYDNWVIGQGNPSPYTVSEFRPVWPWQSQVLRHIAHDLPVLLNHPFSPGGNARWLVGTLTAAGLISVILAFLTKQKKRTEALLLFWLIPVIASPILLILHFYARYRFGPRQMVFWIPFWTMSWASLPAILWRTGRHHRSRWLLKTASGLIAVAMTVAVLCMSWPGLVEIEHRTRVPGWQEATRYLLRCVDEEDLLFVADPRALWFYAPELTDKIVPYYDKGDWSDSDLKAYAEEQLAKHASAYVVPWGPDAMNAAFESVTAEAGGFASEKRIGNVRIYRYVLPRGSSD